MCEACTKMRILMFFREMLPLNGWYYYWMQENREVVHFCVLSGGFSDLNGVLKAPTPGSLSPRHRHLLYLSRQAGRRVIKVSPYDKTGQCYGKLEDVSEKARAKSVGRSTPTIWAPSLVQVEVVNLIISPKIGMDVLAAMKKQGIRFSNSWCVECYHYCHYYQSLSLL